MFIGPPQTLSDYRVEGHRFLDEIEYNTATFFCRADHIKPIRTVSSHQNLPNGVFICDDDFDFLKKYYPRPEQFLELSMPRKQVSGFVVAGYDDCRKARATGRWCFTQGLVVVAGTILGKAVSSLTSDLRQLRFAIENNAALSLPMSGERHRLLVCRRFSSPTNAVSFITGSRQAPGTYLRDCFEKPVSLA
ncbi:MAG: hypothetical protein ACK5UC_21820 [Planctomycetaceae bacterium]